MWPPAFDPWYRERALDQLGIDIEASYRDWMTSLVGVKRAHELALKFPHKPENDGLRPSELKVVELYASGLRAPAVALELGLTEETVKTYVKTGRERLHAKNVTHLVALAIRSGQVLPKAA